MNDDIPPPTEVSNSLRRRLAVRRLVRAEMVYAVVLAAFAVLAILAHNTAFFGWDLALANALQQNGNRWLTAVLAAISLPGNFVTPYILTTVTVLAFWWFGLRSEAVALAISAAGSGMINRLMKHVIGRPRPTADWVQVFPSDHGGASFPSGHVAFYVGFFGFLFFVAYALLPRGSMVRRFALLATAFPVLTVALSRVYLGAHWPSDTLGAYLWSGVWLALVLRLYQHWKSHSTFHPGQREAALPPAD